MITVHATLIEVPNPITLIYYIVMFYAQKEENWIAKQG